MINIHPRIHGLIDYFIGLLFVTCPYLLQWYIFSMPALIFEISGFVIILYSLITKYGYGLLHILTIQKHLLLDAVIGLFILASPFVFGFYTEGFKYHLVAGLIVLVLVGFSTTVNPSKAGSDAYFSHTDKRYY